MTAQFVTTSLSIKEKSQPSWLQRLGLFIVFLVCGLAIFVFGSNYFDIFPTNKNLPYNVIVSVVFLIAALTLRLIKNWSNYWQIAFAFFIASVVFPVTLVFSGWTDTILRWFKETTISSHGIAIAKLYEMILVVLPILVLTKLSGSGFGSIYIKRGNLKMGPGFGAIVFSTLLHLPFYSSPNASQVLTGLLRLPYGALSSHSQTASWRNYGCEAFS